MVGPARLETAAAGAGGAGDQDGFWSTRPRRTRGCGWSPHRGAARGTGETAVFGELSCADTEQDSFHPFSSIELASVIGVVVVASVFRSSHAEARHEPLKKSPAYACGFGGVGDVAAGLGELG